MTPREEEVLAMLDDGVPVAETAAMLGLSASYVEQVRRMFDFNSVGSAMAAQDKATRLSTQALERALLATGKRFA